MQYDGSINFDTRIDSRGFNRGIRDMPNAVESLKRTFENLAKTIGIAFSVGAVLNFSKACLSANQTQIEAEARLGATMRNTIKATKEEIQSVKDLASELQSVGIVGDEVQLAGMQELATYVENAESLKTMLPVLDDMIAQQYGYNATTDSAVTISTMLGKVLQGQTSALSRYGYSFDEAQEKLLKYGTEEERVATLAQVVSESVGGVNKALADTPTGKMKQLSNDFGDLQETLGNMISNIIAPAVKWLDVIVVKLNNIFSSLNQNIKGFFGISDKDMDGFTGAVDEITDSIDEADKSAKKLQKNLAGFDKLNILNSEEQESSKTEAPADLSSLTALENTAESTENTVDSIKNKLLGLFKNTGLESFFSEIKKGFDTINLKAIKNNVDGIFSDLRPIAKTSLDGVVKIAKSSMTTFGKVIGGTVSVTGKSLQTVTGGIAKWLDADKEKISNGIKEISDNLSSGIDNIGIFFDSIFGTLGASIDRMRPTMENAIAVFLGGFSDLGLAVGRIFSSAFDIATGILAQWAVSNEETIGAFFDNVQGTFAQVAELLGGIMTEISEILTGWWYNGGAVVWGEICRAVTDIGTTVMNVYNEWIQPAIDTVIGIVSDLWEYTLRPIFEQVISVATKIGECVADLWSNVLSPVVNWLVEVLAPVVKNVLNVIRGVFQTVFKVIGDVISGFLKALGGITDFLTNVFKGNWKKAFQSIFDVLDGILQMVIGVIKGAFNLVIDALNALISAVYSVFSTVANIIGKASGIIGNVFGQDWSFEMPTEAPLIPKLATGTVIPASYGEFMAILGDNKREPEIVSPVSAMKQAFKEAMAEMKKLRLYWNLTARSCSARMWNSIRSIKSVTAAEVHLRKE